MGGVGGVPALLLGGSAMERERAGLPVFTQYDCQSCFFFKPFISFRLYSEPVTPEWEEEAVFRVNHVTTKTGTFSEFRVDEKQRPPMSHHVSEVTGDVSLYCQFKKTLFVPNDEKMRAETSPSN